VRDKTSGDPVTNFTRSNYPYRTAMLTTEGSIRLPTGTVTFLFSDIEESTPSCDASVMTPLPRFAAFTAGFCARLSPACRNVTRRLPVSIW